LTVDDGFESGRLYNLAVDYFLGRLANTVVTVENIPYQLAKSEVYIRLVFVS